MPAFLCLQVARCAVRYSWQSERSAAYSRIVVVLGENETALRERLMRRFPGARLEHRRVRWYPVEPLFDRLVIAPEDAAQRP